MNVLHIHESTQIHGGAEIYIHQLQYELGKFGIGSYWLGISRTANNFVITHHGEPGGKSLTHEQVLKYLDNFIDTYSIDIINIHTLFEPRIVKHLLDSKPVIKFSHSPVMVCPGRDKFWRHSERICKIPYGLHCFYHIYTEGCANRHPKRVLKAWHSTNFETKIASHRYDRIIVMSEYIRQGLLECNVPDNKILVNPYFTEVIDQTETYAAGLEKRILFSGRVISSKGPHILVNAIAEILRTRSDVFLDIVGDGLMLEDLKNHVEKEGLDQKIIFHGWQERSYLKTLLKNSYVVAVPSLYPEAFGIVGIEALMHARPVVGFDSGGISTWLINNETGFLVPTGDKNLLGKKIAELLDDRHLYNRISANARASALQNYNSQVHLSKLIEVYEHAAFAKKKVII